MRPIFKEIFTIAQVFVRGQSYTTDSAHCVATGGVTYSLVDSDCNTYSPATTKKIVKISNPLAETW